MKVRDERELDRVTKRCMQEKRRFLSAHLEMSRGCLRPWRYCLQVETLRALYRLRCQGITENDTNHQLLPEHQPIQAPMFLINE